MGSHKNINLNKFPIQGKWVGAKVEVCYNYNTKYNHSGMIVRDDREEPYEIIIRLDNGNFVRGVECQFSIKSERSE